jgi:hypothetical protein
LPLSVLFVLSVLLGDEVEGPAAAAFASPGLAAAPGAAGSSCTKATTNEITKE